VVRSRARRALRDDHRDVVSDAQHQKNDRPQCCVSRVVSPRTAGSDGGQAAEYGTVTIDVP
jgi:vanillate O-demethylase ferredoxin subunit